MDRTKQTHLGPRALLHAHQALVDVARVLIRNSQNGYATRLVPLPHCIVQRVAIPAYLVWEEVLALRVLRPRCSEMGAISDYLHAYNSFVAPSAVILKQERCQSGSSIAGSCTPLSNTSASAPRPRQGRAASYSQMGHAYALLVPLSCADVIAKRFQRKTRTRALTRSSSVCLDVLMHREGVGQILAEASMS